MVGSPSNVRDPAQTASGLGPYGPPHAYGSGVGEQLQDCESSTVTNVWLLLTKGSIPGYLSSQMEPLALHSSTRRSQTPDGAWPQDLPVMPGVSHGAKSNPVVSIR